MEASVIGSRRPAGIVIACLGWLVFAAVMGAARADQVAHFPAADQPWSARNYVDFYFAHVNGNRALPHLRTESTAKVFDRIVDQDNISRILSSPSTAAEKRRNVAIILATIGEIRGAYNYAVFVGEPLQEELARVQAFTLFVMDNAVGLETPRPDCSSACRTALRGVIESLSPHGIFSREQILSLAAALERHYPSIAPVLSSDERKDLRAQVSRIAAAERDPALREAHQRLLGTIGRY
jgi:hypothetical protein